MMQNTTMAVLDCRYALTGIASGLVSLRVIVSASAPNSSTVVRKVRPKLM
jgi:hypothetical protein